jgi:predicted amidohydrolase
MATLLKLALAQVTGSPDPGKNLENAKVFAERAAARGAHFIIFPEMFMAIPRKSSPLTNVAESVDGPFVTALGKIAKANNLYLIAGVWEKIPGKRRVRNVAVMLSPEGNLLTAYRKLHLFDALNVRESDTMIPGKDPSDIISVNGFNIGLAICYDLRFPELFRDLAFRGANLIIIPSAWYGGILKEAHWLTLLRSRAIENTAYIVGVNLTGPPFCGRSAVIDPFGISRTEAGETPELLMSEIESGRVDEVRAKLPVLQHCRTGIFEGGL